MIYFISTIITFIGCLFMTLMPAELAKPSKRGLHDIDTPTSAGIALFFGFSIALIYNTQNISPILIILAVMLIVGFLDDKNKAPKLFRFITQIFISMASIYFIGGSSLHPLIFILYTFFMTYFINAYNFMDGIDSILTSQTLFCLISLLALVSTSSPWLPSMQIMISVLLVFMIFNYHPSKLFLGNSGSYFLGTYIAILIIGLHLLKEVNILTSIIILTTSIADTAYAIVSRFLNKLTVLYNQKKSLKNILIISIKHVFNTAHCTHNYQKLAIKFRNHTKSVIVIMLYNLLWCLPLAIMSTINTSYSVLCLLASYTPYIVWCYKNKTGVEEN